MVAERPTRVRSELVSCSLAKISMVAELEGTWENIKRCCSLAKISMVAELNIITVPITESCSLAKISMVAEQTGFSETNILQL